MGNRVKAPIEIIGTYSLILGIGHNLDIFQTFYVPSISKNLVSLSKLLLNLFLNLEINVLVYLNIIV